MTTFEKSMLPAVPAEDQPYVNRFRRWIQDTEKLNRLEAIQESDDLELYEALLSTMDEINWEFTPTTEYENFSDIPSFHMLAIGGLLKILTMKGILSARNTLTYRDGGGVTVQDYDRYGRYTNYFNLLLNKYMRAIQGWKTQVNVESCFGGVHSDYLGVG